MVILIPFAFLGGVVTILSPCILPLLPIILSSSVTSDNKRPIGIVIGFVLSFTFFTLFLATIVGQTGLSVEVLRAVAIVIVFLFGLVMVVPQLQAWWEQLAARLASKGGLQTQKSGFIGGLLIGFSLGLVWAPCVGPIMASIITLAAAGNVNLIAALIVLSYSIGTAIPMLAIIYGGKRVLNIMPTLKKNTSKIQRGFGFLMILTALAIFFNLDRQFQTFILETLPNYSTGLTSLEDNPLVQQQLQNLRNN